MSNEAPKYKIRRGGSPMSENYWLKRIEKQGRLAGFYRPYKNLGVEHEAALSILSSIATHKRAVVGISPLWTINLISKDPNREEPLKINFRQYQGALKILIDSKFLKPLSGFLYEADPSIFEEAS